MAAPSTTTRPWVGKCTIYWEGDDVLLGVWGVEGEGEQMKEETVGEGPLSDPSFLSLVHSGGEYTRLIFLVLLICDL